MATELTIAGGFFGKLTAPLVLKEIKLAVGSKREREKLLDALINSRDIILAADEQLAWIREEQLGQTQDDQDELIYWLEELLNALYTAGDVLDDFRFKALRREVMSRGGTKTKVKNLILKSNPLALADKFDYRKVKKIRKRLNYIQANISETIEHKGVRVPVVDREIETCSRLPLYVFGREDEKENMIQLLIHSTDNERLAVAAIVGIEGLGKTTLVQMVCNDEGIIQHFNGEIIWVWVAGNFDVKAVTKKILISARGGDYSDSTMEQLQFLLNHELNDKKFLLILDDVWNVDLDKWVQLRNLLIGGDSGSKILLTTRSKLVAKTTTASSISIHKLKDLPFNHCLSLFKAYAFRDGEEDLFPSLVRIGVQIVERCGGVPEVVTRSATLLFCKRKDSEWEYVRDNAMQLRCNGLPPHLKRCLAFCSNFPREFRFHSLIINSLWMAQEFIPLFQRGMELEAIYYKYIEELWGRCYIQYLDHGWGNYREESWGSFRSFKVHNVVPNTRVSASHELHQSLIFQEWGTLDNLKKPDHVRVILFGLEEMVAVESLVSTRVPRFKYIRVLDLSCSNFEELPKSIGNLIHMRFLNLSNSKIKKLLNSICKLYFLQTLLLIQCLELENLPNNIGNMISLRHLEITTKQRAFPKKKQGLRCLDSLRFLGIVGCVNLKFMFGGMQSFTSLKTLSIVRCPSLMFLPSIIKRLPALETLRIDDCEMLNLMDGEREDCFQRLQFLVIAKLPKLKFLPRWLLHSASRTLSHLVIKDCPNFKELSVDALKNLTSLTKLEIEDCPQLPALPPGMRHLIALRELSISHCPQLTAFPEEMHHLTALGVLKLSHYPQLQTLPTGIHHLPNLRELKVSHFPELTILLGGMCYLTALRVLKISHCPKLSALAEGVLHLTAIRKLKISHCSHLSALPDGMCHVTALRELKIRGCHQLIEKYRERTAEYWDDIAHVPYVHLDVESNELML